MDQPNYLPDVRNQYELLPYPPVDPKDEHKRLMRTWLEDLPMINHYCFAGKQAFKQGFRALIAGGGTGDASIFMAEQLRATDARIVHLDLSTASIKIAKERAAIRGLTNIDFIHDSLLNIPQLALGRFDYINCSGVLHHLADPDAGLAALTSVLAPDGAMGLMLYGTIGRIGVYQMQAMLGLLNDATLTPQERITQAKQLLAALPDTNWFKRGAELYGDSARTDADIYDMFLHSQDRSYTVEQIFAWMADRHGFHITLSDVQRGRYPYLPNMTLPREARALRERARALDPRAQYAMSELLMGDLVKHSFYLTRSGATVAPYGDPAMIPFFFHEPLTGAALEPVFTSRDGRPITLHHGYLGMTVEIDAGRYSAKILRHIDGILTFGQIFDKVRAEPAFRASPPDNATLFDDFKNSFEALNAIERLLLRRI